MSEILIKGIELPTTEEGARLIIITRTGRTIDMLCEEYEAIPDHGRLIDADAAERHLVKMQQAQKDIVARGVRKSRAVLRDIPTVIPASGGGS